MANGNEMLTLCRLCLSEKCKLIGVFESKAIKGWTAANAIAELLGIQVAAGDIYPQCVCVDCMTKLENFKLYKQQCESSKEFLDRTYNGNRQVQSNEESVLEVYAHDGKTAELRIKEKQMEIMIEKDPLEPDVEDNQIKTEKEDSYYESNEISTREVFKSCDEVSSLMMNEHNMMPVEDDNILTTTNASTEASMKLNDQIHISGGDLMTSTVNNGLLQRTEDSSHVDDNALYTDSIIPEDANEGPTQCDVCGERCTRIEDLENHMSVHSRVKPFHCNICNQGFHLVDYLKEHNCNTNVNVRSEKYKFKCQWCSRKLPNPSALKKHEMTHTGERQFRCNECNKAFYSRSDVSKHMVVHSGDRPYQCDICLKMLSHPSSLGRHMLLHMPARQIPKASLKIKREIQNIERAFKCSECKRSYYNPKDLERHKLFHSGERAHVCIVCQKKFTNEADLKKHAVVHTGERPFTCDSCPKRFTQSSSLRRHKIIVHFREKGLKCSECCKMFTFKYYINMHIKSLTSDGPFECGICNKELQWKQNFILHMKIHLREMPFRCARCS